MSLVSIGYVKVVNNVVVRGVYKRIPSNEDAKLFYECLSEPYNEKLYKSENEVYEFSKKGDYVIKKYDLVEKDNFNLIKISELKNEIERSLLVYNGKRNSAENSEFLFKRSLAVKEEASLSSFELSYIENEIKIRGKGESVKELLALWLEKSSNDKTNEILALVSKSRKVVDSRIEDSKKIEELTNIKNTIASLI
jgi:hypothetical protein